MTMYLRPRNLQLHALAILFVGAFAIRLGWNFAFPVEAYRGDAARYFARAQNLLAHRVYGGDRATAVEPPGYPALIAAFYAAGARSPRWISVFQAALSAISVVIVFCLAGAAGLSWCG